MRSEKRNSPSLDSLSKKNIFWVPEGYFPSLPDRILEKTLEGRKAPITHPFSTPEPYFGQLSESIETRLAARHPLSNKALKQTPFNVPSHYFGPLHEKSNEAHVQSPSLPLRLPLTVPEGYFETLSNEIREKTDKENHHLKVDFRPSATAYMAAASLALLLVAGGLFYALLPSLSMLSSHAETASTLIAGLDKAEIRHYFEKTNLVEETDLLEFTPVSKKEKIRSELETELATLLRPSKEDQKVQWEDLDLAELPSDL